MPETTHVYDLYIGNRAAALLAVAVRLGIFALLDAGPLSTRVLGETLALTERGAQAVVIGLEAMGLIEGTDRGWVNTAVASRELVPGRRDYLGGLIDLENSHFLTPDLLLGALRGEKAAYGGDVWAAHSEDPGKAAVFTRAMHSISVMPANALVDTIELSEGHLLDVGGGSGVFVEAAVKAAPGLRGTVLDLPAVCEIARENFARAGVTDRASAVAANMFTDPWPRADIVLLSQILHDWPYDTGEQLLHKAFDTLEPGGRVLVHEKLLDGSGPLANAMVSLDMLYWTAGQQYSVSRLEEMLRRIGFESIELRTTVGYWSVVVGVRP